MPETIIRLRIESLPEGVYQATSHDIRTVRELLGHKDVKTRMVYTHVLNRAPAGVRSPMDLA